VANAGAVTFTAAPGGRGTEIHVSVDYDPPGGRVGSTVARAFGKEPGQEIQVDLRRLKQVLEVGEVIQSDASRFAGPHPARPAQASSSADASPTKAAASSITSAITRSLESSKGGAR
jgi:hypothetical protein